MNVNERERGKVEGNAVVKALTWEQSDPAVLSDKCWKKNVNFSNK